MSDEPKKLHPHAEEGCLIIPDRSAGADGMVRVRITTPVLTAEKWSVAVWSPVERRQRPDLLPCPFCGAVAVSEHMGGRDLNGEPWGHASVGCSRCTMVGFEGDDELQDVETLWQRRHHE